MFSNLGFTGQHAHCQSQRMRRSTSTRWTHRTFRIAKRRSSAPRFSRVQFLNVRFLAATSLQALQYLRALFFVDFWVVIRPRMLAIMQMWQRQRHPRNGSVLHLNRRARHCHLCAPRATRMAKWSPARVVVLTISKTMRTFLKVHPQSLRTLRAWNPMVVPPNCAACPLSHRRLL